VSRSSGDARAFFTEAFGREYWLFGILILDSKGEEMPQSDALDGAGAFADLLNALREDTSWQRATGRGVRVAIVDSGIDSEHPDLKGRVKDSVEAVAEDGKINFRPPPPAISGPRNSLRRYYQQCCFRCRALQRQSARADCFRLGRNVSGWTRLRHQTKVPGNQPLARNNKARLFWTTSRFAGPRVSRRLYCCC
jgi:hypothetical protein